MFTATRTNIMPAISSLQGNMYGMVSASQPGGQVGIIGNPLLNLCGLYGISEGRVEGIEDLVVEQVSLEPLDCVQKAGLSRSKELEVDGE